MVFIAYANTHCFVVGNGSSRDTMRKKNSNNF